MYIDRQKGTNSGNLFVKYKVGGKGGVNEVEGDEGEREDGPGVGGRRSALRDIVTRLQHKIEKELHSELNQQVASLHGENSALREQNGSLASEIGKLRTKTTELLKTTSSACCSRCVLALSGIF